MKKIFMAIMGIALAISCSKKDQWIPNDLGSGTPGGGSGTGGGGTGAVSYTHLTLPTKA